MEGFREWERARIHCTSQIYQGHTLKAFIEIQEDYTTPTKQFYKYLHTLNAQALTLDLVLTDHTIIEEVFKASEKKGMVSRVYSMLLSALQGDMDLPCSREWERDPGTIDGDVWEACLSAAPFRFSFSHSKMISSLFAPQSLQDISAAA